MVTLPHWGQHASYHTQCRPIMVISGRSMTWWVYKGLRSRHTLGPHTQAGGLTALTSVGSNKAWRWPGGPGLAPGVPCGPLGVFGCTQGGSEEGGRSAWREFCCPRASRAASRASRVLIRSSCGRVTVSSCLTNCWTTRGVWFQLAASSDNPSGPGREATTAKPLAMYNPCSCGWEMPLLSPRIRQTSSRNWMTSLAVASYIFTP